jgi:hypothetical protein
VGVNLGQKIRISEKRILAMLGPDRDNVTGEWRMAAFYSKIIQMISLYIL